MSPPGRKQRGEGGQPTFKSRTGGGQRAGGQINNILPTDPRGKTFFGQMGPKSIPGLIKPIKNPSGTFFFGQVGPLNNYHHGLRFGYCHYYPWWSDWYFGYAYYIFNPIPWQCVFSPYYYYHCVPGYLPFRRVWCGNYTVLYIVGDPFGWNYCGRGYGYGFYNASYNSGYNSANTSALDRALSDLTDAFKYGDATLLDRLVPRGGSIEIFIDGEYSYTVNANEYYDITADLLEGVNTSDFQIVDVRRVRDGGFYVTARHDYLDAWNTRQTNWLTFTLQEQANWYAITQAGTSRSRP
ncbi:MAG: hypothetical protein ACR2HJ_10040 [Fimbriimonadales bacterium]